MLNEIRLGVVSSKTLEVFESLHRPLIFNDGIEATELFPISVEVDLANSTKMKDLDREEF